MFGTVRNLWQAALRKVGADRDAVWLRQLRGVVHVGASTGQERAHYRRHRLPVLWIEPIPEIFAQLQANIAGFEGQRALRALVAEREGLQVPFHVASNNGHSSSMLELGRHREIWPEVGYSRTLELTTTTLDALRRDGQIAAACNGLVMDTQGAELRVLQGAQALLAQIDFVKTEAADFDAYVGGCRLVELDAHLRARGFTEFARRPFAMREGIGAYYDVVYRRSG